jgi:hypothetical protein
MQNKFIRAGLLALILVIGFLGLWEWKLRSQGLYVDYDDNPALWADKRQKAVKLPADKATVFIGSSRIKYDLDINTWRKLTGDEPVQLAMEGNSPLPVLDDLAADEKFKGKLIIDVTEGLFFSSNPGNLNDPKKNIGFYKKETPSEKFSFRLNHALESRFVFLDRDYYSINAFFDRLPIPKRPGVFVMPLFPKEFGRNTFDRQRIMMKEFLIDTNLQNQVTGNWKFFASLNREPPASGAKLDSFLTVIKNNCNKIKARGGQVLFVRTPSSGPYWMNEQKAFPREKYWDRLLAETNCPGIHFIDYRPLDHFVCPEWSHLAPTDAIIFTENFVGILEKDKGWKFPNAPKLTGEELVK